MTRTDRKKIIRKSKNLNILANALVCILVINLILILTIPTFKGIGTDNLFYVMGIIFIGLLLPLFSAMFTYIIFVEQKRKILKEFSRLNTEKYKFHLNLFWESIEKKKYNQAVDYYNIKNFLSKKDQIMCEGILIGVNYLSDDIKTKMISVQRMNYFII